MAHRESFISSGGDHILPKEERDVERSRKNFERAADAVAVLVEATHGLAVPEQTREQWKVLMSAMRIVDDRIDHSSDPAEREALTAQIKASLQGQTVDFSYDPVLDQAMADVARLATEIGEERAHFLHTLLALILRVTEEIKSEKNPDELVRLTLVEGQITGKLFLPFLPAEFKDGKEYQKLVHTLSRFGRGANTFDTFIDMPTDYKNGMVQIKPTILNRVLFLGAALLNGVETIRGTGLPPKLVKEFAWGAKATLESGSEKKKKNAT